MKLVVYKGFSEDFLSTIDSVALCDSSIAEKQNVLNFDRSYRRKLDMSLLSLEDTSEVWVTYEEYSLIKNRVDDAIEEDGLIVLIFKNNVFPDYYPIPFEISPELAEDIETRLNSDSLDEENDSCQRFLSIYNSLVEIDGR